jgi:hypothetical protein
LQNQKLIKYYLTIKKVKMKKLFYAVVFFTLAFGISLTSCSKEDVAQAVKTNVNPEVSHLPTATVTGIAYAKTNLLVGAPDVQYAPQGTKLVLTIENSELLNDAERKGVYFMETTVGDKGAFSFVLPTNNEGVTATINANDFIAKVTYLEDPEDIKATIETHIFSAQGLSTAKLFPNGTTFVKINFEYDPSEEAFE